MENIVNIISQLSSVSVPHNRTSCNKQEQTSLTDILPNIMSLLASIIPEDVTNNASANLNDPFWDDSTLQELLDQRNIQSNDLNLNGILDIQDPYIFAAGAKNNPDVLTQGQMFKAKDQEKFLESQPSEIDGLHEANVFEYLPIKKIPKNRRSKLLNAIWSYRRKRRPDGSLLKNKSRICADGSQQHQGIDFWETYSPVVQWSSVRLMLILSVIHGFASRQVDFIQAFPQAPIDDDVYIRIPQGFSYDSIKQKLVQVKDNPKYKDNNYCIKLKRNLYGCRQASQNWFLHLSKGLEKHGFKPSTADLCLFLRHNAIICY